MTCNDILSPCYVQNVTILITHTKTAVRTVWASPGSAAILAHICAAAQSANRLDEGEQKSEGVVKNKASNNSSQMEKRKTFQDLLSGCCRAS